MSSQQEILNKLATDADFRKNFTSNPQDVFKKYGNLSDSDKTLLTQLAEGFAADEKTSKTSILPTTFKEFAAFIVSVVLMGLLCAVIWETYAMMPNPPVPIQVGNTTQVFDSFGRAKDTMNTLFPLFGAVVTFWLGVAVESKRADQNATAADNANKSKDDANKSKEAAKVTAASALASSRARIEDKRAVLSRGLATGQPDEYAGLISELEKAEREVASS